MPSYVPLNKLLETEPEHTGTKDIVFLEVLQAPIDRLPKKKKQTKQVPPEHDLSCERFARW